MGIYCENSILKKCETNKEFLEKFFRYVFSTRLKTEVVYRPQTRHSWEDINWPGADLAKLYPDYEVGDYVFFSGNLDGPFEREMLINLSNCTNDTEVWFNGEKIALVEAPKSARRYEGTFDAHVTFRKGQNKLLIRVKAKKDLFGATFIPLIPELRMSPDFYVYISWLYTDVVGFRGQKGVAISRLYKKDEPMPSPDKVEWKYPEIPKQSNKKVFDFNCLCKKGAVAYSHTYVEGKITVEHNSPLTVFENGEEVYCERRGAFEKIYDNPTPLLFRLRKDGDDWSFTAKTDGRHSLPFVEGADCPDLQWMWIGPFGNDTDGNYIPYGPEYNLQFSDLYSSVHGPLYWHFFRENTMLLQTAFSHFYGQWFYPAMVGLLGMKKAAEKLGLEKEIIPYFNDWIKLFIRHIDYGKYEITKNGAWSRFLTTGGILDNLDAIGTIGVNVAEYCMMTADREGKYLLQLLADNISYNVPRFEDKTFHRPNTMWTDDTYMSLPFLARLGALTGERRYFDDILCQVRGYVKRMWMEDEKLFSHIYFLETEVKNQIPWGRGNGWVMLALSEILIVMPEEYEGYGEILEFYKKFAEGVLNHLNKETGMWHQVVNNHKSYPETSASAMFITGLARGVRNGWLDNSVFDIVKMAWNSLLSNCVDESGNLYGVCMGSGCSLDEKYYLNLSTIKNDDHGCGIVLQACVEVMNMLGE